MISKFYFLQIRNSRKLNPNSNGIQMSVNLEGERKNDLKKDDFRVPEGKKIILQIVNVPRVSYKNYTQWKGQRD